MVSPEAPVSTPVIDIEEALWNQIDRLAANLSQSSLQFGWVCSELWNMKQEEFLEEAGGKEKKALTLFISHVQDREAKDIDSRKIVADRIHIARFVPRKAYDRLVAASDGFEPTYHQIRGCVFIKGGVLDAEKTNIMFDWCIENKWPTVADIRIYRDSINPKVVTDPKERHFKIFVKMAQVIMSESQPGTDRFASAENVFNSWKASVLKK